MREDILPHSHKERAYKKRTRLRLKQEREIIETHCFLCLALWSDSKSYFVAMVRHEACVVTIVKNYDIKNPVGARPIVSN